jgi:hypothetical protein
MKSFADLNIKTVKKKIALCNQIIDTFNGKLVANPDNAYYKKMIRAETDKRNHLRSLHKTLVQIRNKEALEKLAKFQKSVKTFL